MSGEILVSAVVLPIIGSLVVVALDRTPYRIKALFSMAIATITFILLLMVASDVSSNQPVMISSDLLAEFGVSLMLNADPLAIFFGIVVSFFGMVAIVYSFGDMMHEEGTTRYYALMLIFISSMLGLIMAGNFLVLYAFWELVGLCSFGLIGFYKERLESNRASFKAFFMTRTLGVCLLIGAVILYLMTGSFDIPVVFQKLQVGDSGGIVSLVLVLFLLAAMAKSVQIPFHTWLPDATVAPSAVTSFLHAAAMVKAGVYLISRTYPLVQSIQTGPYLSFAVATIGTVTLTLCSIAAWTQSDIKRIVAYSTCAQIGYMFLAIGIGTGFGAVGGLFHLFNHAIFKGLLFLCAGCVIFTTGTRNLNEMGGLGRKMPLTAIAMIIGALAVVGVPPLNGFASKLMIYEAALERGISLGGAFGAAYVVYCALALFSSAITLAYYLRLINSAFFGRTPENLKDVKDVPLSMQVPLVVLSALCFVFGIYPQWILSVLVNPGVSTFTGLSLSELNNTITGLGYRTGIGFYEATGLTLVVLAAILIGAAIYKSTSLHSREPSKAKYEVFTGGELDSTYIDIQKTRVGTKTFTFAAEKTFGDLQNVMWIGGIDPLYHHLADGVQKFCDFVSAGVTRRMGLLISGVVVIASAFVYPYLPGLLLMIMGVITAVAQRNAKRILVCASVTQVGWIVLEGAFGYPEGIGEALFYMLNFALFGSLLVACLSFVTKRTGTAEVSALRGLSTKIPIAALGFIVGGLSMSGVPPFGGWIDEFYFIHLTLGKGHFELTIIGMVVSVLTLAYVLRTFNQIFLGELPEKYKELKRASVAETGLIVILIVLTLLTGIAPQAFMSHILDFARLAFG